MIYLTDISSNWKKMGRERKRGRIRKHSYRHLSIAELVTMTKMPHQGCFLQVKQ